MYLIQYQVKEKHVFKDDDCPLSDITVMIYHLLVCELCVSKIIWFYWLYVKNQYFSGGIGHFRNHVYYFIINMEFVL